MSSTIKQAIQSLKSRIADAYTAIANKGGTLPATQDSANLPAAIASIPAMEAAKTINRGGELGNYTVFFDIDGSVLYAYTQQEIQELTELPVPYVTHERLTFDRWSYTLEELRQANGWRDVGAHYYPTDGFGEFELDYRDCKLRTPHIGVKMRTADGLIVDWGDGNIETLPAALEFDLQHTYAVPAKYLMRWKQENDAKIYGVYVWNDTKPHVVGRCVYPTNAECVSCSPLTGQSENTTYEMAQGIGRTMIEELAIPYSCLIGDGNYSSGIYLDMPMLKAVSGQTGGFSRGISSIPATINGIFESALFVSITNNSIIPSVPRGPMYARSFFMDYYLSNGKLPSFYNPNIERIGWPSESLMTIEIRSAYPTLTTKKLKSLPPINNTSWWNNGGIRCNSLEVAPDFSAVGCFYSNINSGFMDCYKIRDWEEKYNGEEGTYAIGNNCFANNYSLRTFTSGHGTPSIAATAFAKCYSLEEIHIERSVVIDGSVTTLANVNAFSGCPNTMKIYVPADSVSAYKAATNWATYANQIFAEPE